MKTLVQYGKQSNQPINLVNVNTFYLSSNGITFVFTNEHTQVWQFASRNEAVQVYNQILNKECSR